MAGHERHRSRSRSPGPRRAEHRADKKRKREEKVNGTRDRESHPSEHSEHGTKRRKSRSPERHGYKRRKSHSQEREARSRTNGATRRSPQTDRLPPRNDKYKGRPEPDRRRSRSPVRDVTETNARARQRSPLRGPRSGRSDRDRRHGDRTHEKLIKSEKVPDPMTAAAVPKRRRKKDDPEDGEDEVEYVIDDGTDAFRNEFMAFFQFKSTKNTKVPGNSKLYGVRKEKKTEYRQYMNRIGGFNRPLSPSQE